MVIKMDSKITYTIVLTQEEAEGLKILLGKESLTSKTSKGLSVAQANQMSELYDLLPYEEEDEN